MRVSDTFLRALQHEPDTAVDSALAAALPTADADSLRRIVPLLLERGRPAALLALVTGFHRLPEDSRHQVVRHADRLFRALREAATLATGPGPANAAAIIEAAGSMRLAYLLAEQLRRAGEEQKRSAAASIWKMARLAGATTGPAGATPAVDAESAAFLLKAVEEAVASYSIHRRPEALLAAAELLPRATPRTLDALRGDGDAARAWNALLQNAQQPAARRAIPMMLGHNRTREAATIGLSRAARAGLIAEIADASHLLPPRPRRTPVEVTWPAPVHRDRLRANRVGLVRLVPYTPGGRAAHIERLASFRHDHDPAARLAALRRLAAMEPAAGEAEALEAILAFCGDPHPGIARAAATFLLASRRLPLARLLTALVDSEHAAVRRMAALRLAPEGFQRLWEAWPAWPANRRSSAGRALLKLALSDRAARLRALGIVTELNQGVFFRPAILRLAASADAYIASAAVAALATAPGEETVSALKAALNHADARVRANSVEALAHLRAADHTERLVAMADDDAGRPRANAVAALMTMRTEEALPALRRMLTDPRPGHRRSALWVVEQMGIIEAATQVAELSISDTDPAVRSSATETVQRLVALLGGGCEQPATPGERTA